MSLLKIKVEGAKEAIASLKNASDAIKRKYMRIAMNASGGQLKNAAVSRAPVRTRLLRQALAVKVTQARSGEWYVVVGAKRGMRRAVKVTRKGTTRALSKRATSNLRFTPGAGDRKYVDPARYIHLAEKGSRAHYVSVRNRRALSNGSNIFGRRVVVQAKPSRFLAAASQTAGPAALQKAISKLKQLIEAHNNKQ